MAESTNITVELASGTLDKLMERVHELKFADAKTYLLYLIAIDLAEDKTHAAQLMKQIYQAEASGDARVGDDDYFRELKQRTDVIISEAAARSKRAVG